jgi:thiamine-monophosphate kinase
MQTHQLGEFELIDRLRSRLTGGTSPRVKLDIGDDAAVWEPTPGTLTVATTDALVQDVHFSLETTGWRDLGWKALAENVSDVAAMGAAPRYALVALGIPGSVPVGDLEALYDGFNDCLQTYRFALVGGDLVRAPVVTLQVTLVGETLSPDGSFLSRDAGRLGDLIAVTGPVGGSAAGLRLLLDRAPLRPGDDALLDAHRRPRPRVGAARALIEAGIRCALDVSDGLVQDVGHICERSGVDAELDADRIPLFPPAVERFGDDALELGLTGGEDYELVCAGSPAAISLASSRMQAQREEGLFIIGRVVPRAGNGPMVKLRQPDGELRSMVRGGYQHFGGSA